MIRIYCSSEMVIPRIMFIPKILTDLCKIRQNKGIKHASENVIYYALVVEKYW